MLDLYVLTISNLWVFYILFPQHSEVSTEKYFRYNFKSVLNSRMLTRYIVLNVEPILTTARPSAKVGKVRTKGGSSVARGRGEGFIAL